MSQPIDDYLDKLMRDPDALPPEGMDADTAAFVRSLVAAGTVSTPPALRRRIWQRSLNDARARSQTPTFTPSSNGHQVHTFDNPGDEPMAQVTLPVNWRARQASTSQRIGVLTLVAAIALVIIGVMLLTTMRSAPSYLNAPEDPNSAGSLLQGTTETPTASPISTALPTIVPEAIPEIVEYIIQPGDTLLFILQRFNIEDFAAIRQIMELNEIDQLPAPGTMIRIPLPTPTPVMRPPANAEATAQPPTVVPPVVSTASPTPVISGGGAASTPQVTTYVVQEGDTLVALLMQFDTTLRTLAELNPQLNFSGCDFTRFSGGAGCRVVPTFTIGDDISVPFYPEAADSDIPTPEAGMPPIVTATPLTTAAPR